MKRLLPAVALVLCALWLASCAPAAAPLPAEAEPRTRTVHVLSNGWHTAVIVPRAAAAATGLLPEAAHFPDANYLEFGWGDRKYYPAEEATLGLTLRAALVPTPAIMHMAGRARLPETGEGREVVRAPLTEDGFRALVGAVAESFERPEGGPAAPVGPGLYPQSRFYAATGRFHLFNTCNTWTARVLRAGGVPISPAGVITAGDLMERLRAAVEPGGSRGGAGAS